VKRVFIIQPHPHPARDNAVTAVLTAPVGVAVTLAKPTRSTKQNAAQWPILDAFSRSLQWPVNGQMVYMTAEEWKDVLTAAFRGERARLAMGLDGGVVMLGSRTSQFESDKFSEWLEFLNATAAHRGVEV